MNDFGTKDPSSDQATSNRSHVRASGEKLSRGVKGGQSMGRSSGTPPPEVGTVARWADLVDAVVVRYRPRHVDGQIVDMEVIAANEEAQRHWHGNLSDGAALSTLFIDPTAALAAASAAWSSGRPVMHHYSPLVGSTHLGPMVDVTTVRDGDDVVQVLVTRTEVCVDAELLAAVTNTHPCAMFVIEAEGDDLRVDYVSGSEVLNGSPVVAGDLLAGDAAAVVGPVVRRVLEGECRVVVCVDGLSVTALAAGSRVVVAVTPLLVDDTRRFEHVAFALGAHHALLLLEPVDVDESDWRVQWASAVAVDTVPGLVTGMLLRDLAVETDDRTDVTALLSPATTTVTIGHGPDRRIFDMAVAVEGPRRIVALHNMVEHTTVTGTPDRCAHHDDTTGLPNRLGLQQQLEAALSSLDRDRRTVAVVAVNFRDLEMIERTYGFPMAERALDVAVARLLGLTTGQLVGRLSPTWFLVVVDPVTDAAALQTALEKGAQQLTRPIDVDGAMLHLEVSVGVAFAPLHGLDPEVLLMRAKAAAWSAAHTRRTLEVWRFGLDVDLSDQLALLAEVDRALGDGELVCDYQPKLSTVNGQLLGVEVLVRWHHPTRGSMAPSLFVPHIEQSVHCRRFTDWMLRSALTEWAQLPKAVRGDARVAVNLPAFLAGDAGVVAMVENALIATGASPQLLELEITERGLLPSDQMARTHLAELRELGVRLTIDDFGTGQASLGYLRRLPVDEVKIDRAFVRHLERDNVNRAVVTACVGVADAVGVNVTAEGVETQSELAAVTELGCDAAQGYLLGRPSSLRRLFDTLKPAV